MTTTRYGGQSPSGQLNSDVTRDDFSLGRVSAPYTVDYSNVKPGQSPLMYNVDTSGKSVRKMKGYKKVTSTPLTGDISSLWFDKFTNNVFVGYGTKLASLTGSTVTNLSAASYTNNSIWSFSRNGDYILAVNGKDAPVTYNTATSTVAAITTPPATWTGIKQPAFAETWMGRSFAAGIPGEPDILYFSKLYNVNDWTAGVTATDGGAFKIGNDGRPITAILALAEWLLVFKDPGLYAIKGSFDNANNFDQTTFDWSIISNSVSARSHRAVIATEDSLFCWGRTGVYQLQGTQSQQRVEATIISNDISYDVVNAINVTDQITAAHYPERNQIWFAVSQDNAAKIDRIHCYDYVNNAWMLRNGYNHKCHATVLDSSSRTQIYSGGYSDSPYIYVQNTGLNYDTNPMPCIYYTDWIPFATSVKGKAGLAIFQLGPQTVKDIEYSYAYDYNPSPYDSSTLSTGDTGSTWNSTGSAIFSTGSSTKSGYWNTGASVELEKVMYGNGRRIQHRFSSNTLDSDFAILNIKHPSITVGYK